MEVKAKTVFNLKEAAAYLGISVPTLAALLHEGTIPCRRAGQRWLISKTALDDWLTNPDIKN
ncbi:MAG: helix-turn-helix domain-containing protein [Eubacteriales bacterium]|nr:helix-turn-helix domain-containing protein [Eubacteriales bacterium]